MKLLDKLYEKSHLTFAIVWIVAYVVLASTADGISLDLGTEKLVTVPVLAALTALLWAWIRHAKLEGFFFLRKFASSRVDKILETDRIYITRL